MTRRTLALALVALLGACASDPYSDYPDSLYESLDDGTPAAWAEHAALLSEIVEYNDARKRPPPPGTLVELAWYQARLGDYDRVAELLERERAYYPESGKFVSFVERTVLGPEQEEERP